MKNTLKNLNEALTYQMEGLYDAEKSLQKAIPAWEKKISSVALKNELHKYGEQIADKRTKLKRIFSYLSCGPFGRKDQVVRQFVNDTNEILEDSVKESVREAVFMVYLRAINQHKIANCSSAAAFAVELQLDNVADLLDEILTWENETSQALSRIALEQINVRAHLTENAVS